MRRDELDRDLSLFKSLSGPMNRGHILSRKLWALDAESAWKSNDIEHPRGGHLVFSRYLVTVLDTIRAVFREVETAYAGISGLEPSIFKPIAAVGRDIKTIVPSHQNQRNTTVSRILSSPDTDVVEYIQNIHKDPLYKGDKVAKSKIVIKLIGYGELRFYFA